MMLRAKPASCQGCACFGHGTDFTQVEGTGSSGILLVGEASGEQEQREGLPFRPGAPAGGILQRTLREMSLDRAQFAITNVLRCRPRHNLLEGMPWEYPAIAQCRSNLEQVIRERRPRVIVALGGTALRELTGMAGEARGITHLAGYVLPCTVRGGEGIPVVANYHPSFIRHGKASYRGLFARILQRALNIAKGADQSWLWAIDAKEASSHDTLRYSSHPSLDEARAFAQGVRDHGELVVSYDIETHESASLDEDARDGFADTQLRLIQFSLGAGTGIAFPWEGEYRHIAQSILQSPNVKCGHNVWTFDNRVLRAAGEREGLDLVPRGTIHDTLWMFHHWQPDLPAHLQAAAAYVQFPFPWKHLAGTDLEFYGCCDVDATLRLYLMLEKTLRRDLIWGDATVGYLGQVAAVRPILDGMERRGLPIDDVARVALGKEFDLAQEELGAALTIRAEGCGLVDIFATLNPELRQWFQAQGTDPRRWQEHPTPDLERLYAERWVDKDGAGYHYAQRVVDIPGELDGNPALIPTVRWCRVWEFNPNSRPQLFAYMAARKHPIPKSRKNEDAEGNAKQSAEKKELQRLATKTSDDFYLKVIEYKELTKAKGTYVDGFVPGPDGRVHTTFTFDTGIGQLSCCASWTPVTTKEWGKIPIVQVRVGDHVWTHRRRWRQVTALWTHRPENMYSVHFSNGEVLTCTSSHRLLSSGYEHQQKMGDRGEYTSCFVPISECGITDGTGRRYKTWDQNPQHLLGAAKSHVAGRIQSAERPQVFTLEDGRQESHEGQDERTAPPVYWRGNGWGWVYDLFGRWPSGASASSDDGEGSGNITFARRVGRTSHRRQSEEQCFGQFRLGDEDRTSNGPLATKGRDRGITIEKVLPMGSFPVYDITVEEDESYESCGVFSHNSRNPNIQNFPKHGRLAKPMRRMVAAPPGYVLTEWDFKSCHIITLGFLAEDLNYMRLGRLDMHSFVAGHFLGLWDGFQIFNESDDQLRARFKALKANPKHKRVRDDQAKHGILGIGNGLRAQGLFERYMESFPARPCPACKGTRTEAGVRGLRKCAACQGQGIEPGRRIAERVLEIAEALFPKVFAWQKRIQLRAHEQQFLRTEFGHIRRFYEVFRWDPRRQAMGHGDQAEEAISFWLSNIAFGHIREAMKELARHGLDVKYGLMNNIHDAFEFCFPEEMLQEHVAEIAPLLAMPSKVLRHPTIAPGGLVIDVEGSWGPNWAAMSEIKLPVAKEAALV